MKIKIINKSKHPLPKYQTELSAGMDLYANITEPVRLGSLERTIIPTGIFIALPALKKNSPKWSFSNSPSKHRTIGTITPKCNAATLCALSKALISKALM